jgi:hypothetical protein
LPSARVLAVRAALLGIVLASGACFRPKILSGGFRCDATPGAKSCPDDFVCTAGLCVTPATDAGTDMAKGGSGGAGGKGGGGGGGGGGGQAVDAHPDVPCLTAVTLATCSNPSDAGLCDPVCNTGCLDCHTKCSVDSTGELTCNKPYQNGSNPGIQHVCDLNLTGADQQDNCAPGQVCMSVECGARCKQFCRDSSDCTTASSTAACSRDAGGGLTVCDVPYADLCDPVAGAATTNSGCSEASIQGCYLSANSLRTLCDCSFKNVNEGKPCSHSRDCFAGLACFDPSGGVNGATCIRVCRLPSDAGTARAGEQPCPGASPGVSRCMPFPGANANALYGYCN